MISFFNCVSTICITFYKQMYIPLPKLYLVKESAGRVIWNPPLSIQLEVCTELWVVSHLDCFIFHAADIPIEQRSWPLRVLSYSYSLIDLWLPCCTICWNSQNYLVCGHTKFLPVSHCWHLCETKKQESLIYVFRLIALWRWVSQWIALKEVQFIGKKTLSIDKDMRGVNWNRFQGCDVWICN